MAKGVRLAVAIPRVPPYMELARLSLAQEQAMPKYYAELLLIPSSTELVAFKTHLGECCYI